MTNRYTIVNAGIVGNIVISDAEMDISWVDINGIDHQPAIGWAYDGTTFSAPEIQADVLKTPIRTLSKLDYMNRFTDTELAVIYTAAKSSVVVEVWLEKFKLATDINLDDARTVAGVQALEAGGLIHEGRSAVILA